jgi:hypothetical protein
MTSKEYRTEAGGEGPSHFIVEQPIKHDLSQVIKVNFNNGSGVDCVLLITHDENSTFCAFQPKEKK